MSSITSRHADEVDRAANLLDRWGPRRLAERHWPRPGPGKFEGESILTRVLYHLDLMGFNDGMTGGDDTGAVLSLFLIDGYEVITREDEFGFYALFTISPRGLWDELVSELEG